MNLDVRTMYMAMAATCFIVALSLFIFQVGRFRRDGTLLWTVGWTFQGAFWILLGLRGVVWDFVSIVVAHTFLAASFSLFYGAVRQFQGRPYHRGVLLFPPAATFVFFWYFSAYVDNVSYRVTFISLLSILQISAIIRPLFREAPAHERRSCWLTGFAFFVYALVFLNRLLEALTLSYGQMSVLVVTTLRNISITAGFGVAILSSIGFVLMIRERTEEALRESEKRYRSLFNGMTEGFALHEILCDKEGEPWDYRFLEINPAFEQLTGLRREDVLGKTMSQVLPQDDPKWVKIYGQVALTGKSIHFDNYSPVLKRHYEVFAYCPAPCQFGVLFMDITERKESAEAQRKSQQLFSTLFRVNPGATILSSLADGKCVDANEAYAKLTGYTREELLGKTTVELNIWISAVERQSVVTELARKGHLENVELTLRRKNGEIINTIASGEVITLDGQRYILSFFFDITERKTIEEELRKSHDELEIRVQERTEELVKTNERLMAEVNERKQAEDQLLKSDEQLRHLSTNLLTIQEREKKRISQELHDNIWQTLMAVKMGIANKEAEGETVKTAGILSLLQNTIETIRKMQGDLWPYPLDDLGLLQTIEWFCREFQKNNPGIVLEKHVGLSEDEVPGSLGIFIHRVIQEALDNISKHSQASHVSLSLQKKDGKIELVVKDNGIGFDLEETFVSKGFLTGLGLMSLRGQVEHSGGSLKIESTKEKGTALKAIWPIERFPS